MSDLPNCPQCGGEYCYQDANVWICPTCAFEWNESSTTNDDDALIIKDANGNLLADGDDIILTKDLKLKGSSTVIKKGAKAKGIRLVAGDHEIDCKVDGIKVMLKACFVKKA